MNKLPAKSEENEIEVIEPEQPREGTLAWLRLQPHTEVDGRSIPGCHRLDLDAGHLLHLDADDGRCQYVRPSGERCRAPRLLDYGICNVHAGGGMQDQAAMSKVAHAQKAKLKLARTTLGISARRAADPRQLSRVLAQARAQEIAEALLAPLDADDLGPMTRQRAAQAILDALWPQEQLSVTLEVPANEGEVQAMGWREMQQLASELLRDSTETAELEPA